jgi:acetyl esterase/lipase
MKFTKIRTIIISGLLLFSAVGLHAQEGVQSYSEIRRDVVYGDSGIETSMDIYLPVKGEKPYPVHIYIHGGGWTGGNKKIGGDKGEVFKELSQQGFIGISVEYRRKDSDKNQYLRECVVDSVQALRYVFAHADEWGINKENIFVWGGSAGAHLALMVSAAEPGMFPGSDKALDQVETPVNAVVAWFPPTDMEHYEQISVEKNGKLRDLSNRMGCKVEDEPEAYKEISPLEQLGPDFPAVCLFHGDSDPTVNFEHSIRFHEKAQTLGVESVFHVVPGAKHGFGSAPRSIPSVGDGKYSIPQLTAQFFVDHLKQ